MRKTALLLVCALALFALSLAWLLHADGGFEAFISAVTTGGALVGSVWKSRHALSDAKLRAWMLTAILASVAGLAAPLAWNRKTPVPPATPIAQQLGEHTVVNGAINSHGPVNVGSGTQIINNALPPELLERLEARNQELGALRENNRLLEQERRALLETIAVLRGGNLLGATPSSMNEALSALTRGETTKAERLFEQAALHAERESAAMAQASATAYRHLGALAFLHDTQKALAAYRKATGLDPDNIDGWNRLGGLLQRIGEVQNAEDCFQRALQIAARDGNKRGVIISNTGLGLLARTRSQLDRAAVYHNTALKLAKDIGDQQATADAYGNLGVVYSEQGDLSRALKFHEDALRIHEALASTQSLAIDYHNIAGIQQHRGALADAVESFKRCLQLSEQIGRTDLTAAANMGLGRAYHAMGEPSQAIAYLEKSLRLHEQLGDVAGIAGAFGHLGMSYRAKGELTLAIKYIEKSLELHKQLTSKLDQAANYSTLGLIYHEKGELTQSLTYHEAALALMEEVGSIDGIAVASGNIGNFYLSLGQIPQAIAYLRKSLRGYEELGSPIGIAKVRFALGMIYKEAGNAKESTENLRTAAGLFREVGDLVRAEEAERVLNDGQF